MEEEIKKLNTGYEKLRIEYDELAKKNDVVLLDNKMLEDQLREEKFLTQEAEEVQYMYCTCTCTCTYSTCMYNCNYYSIYMYMYIRCRRLYSMFHVLNIHIRWILEPLDKYKCPD